MNVDPERLNRSFSSLPFLLLIILSIAIVCIFLLVCVRAPLWYDEANYLTLATAIRAIGYPIWFWIPEQPVLFHASPPAILYLIGLLSAWISSNVVVLRILFVVLFGLTPFVFLAMRAFRKGDSLIPVSTAALFATCTGIFLMELIQLRFDLPLACLSCLILILSADTGNRSPAADPKLSRLSLCCLFALSALAFLTKFQAVCLTGALVLDVLLAYFLSERWTVRCFAFLTHLAGAGLAVAAIAWWSASSEYASGAASISNTVSRTIFEGIFPTQSLEREIINFTSVAKQILVVTILPTTVLLIASAFGKIDWNDRLLRLFVLMTVMVIAFNLIMYRLPGAGNYYMTQAVIPLGYILGRSFESLHKFFLQRPQAVFVLVVLLILHGVLNLPPATRAIQPNVNQMVADSLAPVLRFEDVLLLDDENQSRTIPYLLHRFDRYGFLFYMDPASAANLLQRNGSGRVGAMVFLAQSSAKLASEKWSAVGVLIEQKFFRATQLGRNPQLVVYLRRDSHHIRNDERQK